MAKTRGDEPDRVEPLDGPTPFGSGLLGVVPDDEGDGVREQIRREGGKLESVIVHKGSKTVELIPLSPEKVTRLTLPPPADWVKADFDDGSWDRQPGPFR